ncbi:alanine racemase [Synchytrium microbalum]|uniref:Pyridoxal phosphate homeostasis protein n=1 Tax=Synchytrium microbalum TaxID=1806994 RepID=A0A507CAN8_9FUNG|nr:alanine racemase [Synchytrium microbalum]TPX34583.1 alanine racemase [Synchytrium microbalum]
MESAKPIIKLEDIVVDEARLAEISDNIKEIKTRIDAACLKAGRETQPRLVAVSKTKPLSDLMAAYDAGHRHFGENYVRDQQVNELQEKAAILPRDIQWHFIGHLQSNKSKILAAIPNLYMLETIDGIKKADAMNKVLDARTTPLQVFMQVNTSGEESKGGIEPAEVLDVATHILDKCPKLKLAGLMTIGAPENGDKDPNPDFVTLQSCRDKILESLKDRLSTLELSMGMSDDFENATKAGSTNVRVGSKIFGARSYPAKS